jgi:hypothetical protein
LLWFRDYVIVLPVIVAIIAIVILELGVQSLVNLTGSKKLDIDTKITYKSKEWDDE